MQPPLASKEDGNKLRRLPQITSTGVLSGLRQLGGSASALMQQRFKRRRVASAVIGDGTFQPGHPRQLKAAATPDSSSAKSSRSLMKLLKRVSPAASSPSRGSVSPPSTPIASQAAPGHATPPSSAASDAGSSDAASTAGDVSSIAEQIWTTWGISLASSGTRWPSSCGDRPGGSGSSAAADGIQAVSQHLAGTHLEQLTLMTVWGLSESLDDQQLLLDQLPPAPGANALGEPPGIAVRSVCIPFTLPLKLIVPASLGPASPAAGAGGLPAIVVDSVPVGCDAADSGEPVQAVLEQLFGSRYAASGCKPRELGEAYTALARGCPGRLLAKVLAVHQLPAAGRTLFVLEARGSDAVNLAQWLQQLRQRAPRGATHLSSATVVHITQQLAAAIDFLHRQEVICNPETWSIRVHSQRRGGRACCGSSGSSSGGGGQQSKQAAWVRDGSGWTRSAGGADGEPAGCSAAAAAVGVTPPADSSSSSNGTSSSSTSTTSSLGDAAGSSATSILSAGSFQLYLTGQVRWVKKGQAGAAASTDYAALGSIILFLLCLGDELRHRELVQLLHSARGRAGSDVRGFRELLCRSFRKQVAVLPGDGVGGCVPAALVDLVMSLVVPDSWQAQADAHQEVLRKLQQVPV